MVGAAIWKKLLTRVLHRTRSPLRSATTSFFNFVTLLVWHLHFLFNVVSDYDKSELNNVVDQHNTDWQHATTLKSTKPMYSGSTT